MNALKRKPNFRGGLDPLVRLENVNDIAASEDILGEIILYKPLREIYLYIYNVGSLFL